MLQMNPYGVPEGQFEAYNQIQCPFCHMTLGFGEDIVGKDMIECSSCKKQFSYDDGFVERIANLPLGHLFVFSSRLGAFQIGKTSLNVGEFRDIIFSKPFYKVSGAFLVDSQGQVRESIETSDYSITGINLSNTGFRLISSKSNPNFQGIVDCSWIASGAASNRKIPAWHIFFQNMIDLLVKAEYGTVIVMAMMTLDSYLDNILLKNLTTQHKLPEELANRIILSPKFGRNEFLGVWLKALFGKSFTENCEYNTELKEFATMRVAIVHPTQEGLDETKLTFETAQKCIDVTVKSIKWLCYLKLGIIS